VAVPLRGRRLVRRDGERDVVELEPALSASTTMVVGSAIVEISA
jgi:hypothetical protein